MTFGNSTLIKTSYIREQAYFKTKNKLLEPIGIGASWHQTNCALGRGVIVFYWISCGVYIINMSK